MFALVLTLVLALVVALLLLLTLFSSTAKSTELRMRFVKTLLKFRNAKII
jgi:hypothetical protein